MKYKVGVFRSTFISKNERLKEKFKSFADGINKAGDIAFLQDDLSYKSVISLQYLEWLSLKKIMEKKAL